MQIPGGGSGPHRTPPLDPRMVMARQGIDSDTLEQCFILLAHHVTVILIIPSCHRTIGVSRRHHRTIGISRRHNRTVGVSRRHHRTIGISRRHHLTIGVSRRHHRTIGVSRRHHRTLVSCVCDNAQCDSNYPVST